MVVENKQSRQTLTMTDKEMSEWIRGHMHKSKFHDMILLGLALGVAVSLPLAPQLWLLKPTYFVTMALLVWLANR